MQLSKNFYKEYTNFNVVSTFDPFEIFVIENNLSYIYKECLLPIALNIPMINIAEILNKSIRTIQKYVDELKILLQLQSKNELFYLLSSYYINEVKLWIVNQDLSSM